jgi:hypothetical protein
MLWDPAGGGFQGCALGFAGKVKQGTLAGFFKPAGKAAKVAEEKKAKPKPAGDCPAHLSLLSA